MPTATLKDLKDAINKAYQQEFDLFTDRGRILTSSKDDETLESLGIKDCSNIMASFRMKGGI